MVAHNTGLTPEDVSRSAARSLADSHERLGRLLTGLTVGHAVLTAADMRLVADQVEVVAGRLQAWSAGVRTYLEGGR